MRNYTRTYSSFQFFCVVVFLIVFLSCESRKNSKLEVVKPQDQEFQITLGGFIYQHENEGTLDGFCAPTDLSRTEVKCDVYNGLRRYEITETSILVVWKPYSDQNRRLYRVRAQIPPNTTQTIRFKLGFELPREQTGWSWTYGPVKAHPAT